MRGQDNRGRLSRVGPSCWPFVLRRGDGKRQSVSKDMLQQLIDIGVAAPRLNAFGEITVRVRHDAIRYRACVDTRHGTTDVLSHLPVNKRSKATKLELLMCLERDGWVPAGGGDLVFYTEGSPKQFKCSLSRSRLYFAALALTQHMLPRLPIADGAVPSILHAMNQIFFCFNRVLATSPSTNVLAELLAVADSSPAPYALEDNDFAGVLKDTEKCAADEEEPPPPLAIADARRPAVREAQRVALQVLVPIAGSPSDLIKKYEVTDCGVTTMIHLDGCSHQRGNQRAWTSCGVRTHSPCLNYVFLHNYESELYAVAWFAAWRFRGMHTEGLSKKGHLDLVPPDDEVRALMPLVKLVP